MIAQIMKRLILLIAAIWSVAVCSSAQGFGYSYSAGREDVQMQTPIAATGADRPEDIWAVSGNMQPFGTCANDADTPPLRLFACRKTQTAYYGRRRPHKPRYIPR